MVKASINDFSQCRNCGMNGYKPGDIRRSAHIMDLAKQIQVSENQLKQNGYENKATIENEKHVGEGLECERRKKEGITQMIIAGTIIAVSVFVIAATWGAMATVVAPVAASTFPLQLL